jgi:hypothetical protein
MDVITIFVKDPQFTLLERQGEDSLDYTPGFPSPFPWPAYLLSIRGMIPLARRGLMDFLLGIIRLICLQLRWSFAPSTARALDGRNRIHQWHRQLGVMDIGPGLDHRERDPLAIADEMPFRDVFPAIRGIGARFRPPKSARTELLSTTALDQSILSAKPNSSSRTCQTFCQTP